MNITAILVTFNSAHIIGEALAALKGLPVIVADNASRDGTALVVRAEHPGVRLLEMGENLGFGRANNRALAEVDTEFALLINPDARLLPGGMEALLEAGGRYPQAGIIAPQLVDAEGRPQEGHKRDVFARERDGGVFVPPEGECSAPFLSGACWLVRMSAWRAMGGFDEGIFLYYEDDDACLRMRRAGFCCVLTPQARAVHGLGRSSRLDAAQEKRRQAHLTWSRLYMERKYKGERAARRRARRLLVIYGLKYLIGKRRRYGGRLAGVRGFLVGEGI